MCPRRVLVSKNTQNIIPKWLCFLKGVVDCDDVSLNISREGLQDSRTIEKLSTVLVRRVLKFLSDEAKQNPETYKTFYNKYSQFLKVGKARLRGKDCRFKFQATSCVVCRLECRRGFWKMHRPITSIRIV